MSLLYNHILRLLHWSLQYFVERLSNYTGYSTSKLVGKKLWRVYDTLTCQVNTPALSSITVTVANSSCRAVRENNKGSAFSYMPKEMRRGDLWADLFYT